MYYDSSSYDVTLCAVSEQGKKNCLVLKEDISRLVVDEKSRLYFLSEKGQLKKFSTEGKVVFSKQVCGKANFSATFEEPLIYHKGAVYVYCGGLHKFNMDGNIVWSIKTAGNHKPLPDTANITLDKADGTLYVWVFNSVYAYSLDGKEKWRFEKPFSAGGPSGGIWAPPVKAGGNLFVVVRYDSDVHDLFMLDIKKRKKWKKITVVADLLKVNDGLMAASTYKSEILGISGAGKILWKKKYETGDTNAAMDVSGDKIYTFELKIRAFSLKGNKLWVHSPGYGNLSYDDDKKKWENSSRLDKYAFMEKGTLCLYEVTADTSHAPVQEQEGGPIDVKASRELVCLSGDGKVVLRHLLEPAMVPYESPGVVSLLVFTDYGYIVDKDEEKTTLLRYRAP